MLGTCKSHFVQEEAEAREGPDWTEVTQSGNAGCCFYFLIYLAAPGLSWTVRGLGLHYRAQDLLAVAYELPVAAC